MMSWKVPGVLVLFFLLLGYLQGSRGSLLWCSTVFGFVFFLFFRNETREARRFALPCAVLVRHGYGIYTSGAGGAGHALLRTSPKGLGSTVTTSQQ